jgi:cytochrome c biogenesis protein CcmG/thiol:disulfide interchange protein DsbE
MQSMRRFVLPGLIALAAIGLLALLTFGISKQTDTSSIDAQVARGTFPVAPNSRMALPLLGTGRKANLADYRGKVVVLNVYASWCTSCQAESPLLAAEQHALAHHDATLLGVTYLDNSDATEQFNRRYGITYPVLRDVSGNFVRSYGTDAVPETFVINRQGRVQALQRYPINRQWIAKTLDPILQEKS